MQYKTFRDTIQDIVEAAITSQFNQGNPMKYKTLRDTIAEGSDYYAVEGTVDNQAGGAQTAPTMQEAEHYAKAMFAYLKKASPKAKKIKVEIYKVVNYERKDTPMKVLTVAEAFMRSKLK